MDREVIPSEQLKMEIDNLLEIFKNNLMKAFVIGELKANHVEGLFDDTIKESFNNLNLLQPVDSISRSQSLVMLVTSFEAFTRDLFKKVIIFRPVMINKVMQKLEGEKWDSTEIMEVSLYPEKLPEKIIEKKRLTFQGLGSLIKVFNLLDIDFKFHIIEAEKRAKEHFSNAYPEQELNFEGISLISELFDHRHRIVHEGEVYSYDDLNMNMRVLFLQYLSRCLAENFCDPSQIILERKFTFNKEIENVLEETNPENPKARKK